jgi:hypothetical protein
VIIFCLGVALANSSCGTPQSKADRTKQMCDTLDLDGSILDRELNGGTGIPHAAITFPTEAAQDAYASWRRSWDTWTDLPAQLIEEADALIVDLSRTRDADQMYREVNSSTPVYMDLCSDLESALRAWETR